MKYICRQVRGSKGVWGYGLWYDNGTNGKFLNHAVEKLRLWDPTHVTYVGSYRHRGLETVTINPGCYGWYDFHWKRGTLWHYLDLKVLHELCQRRHANSGNCASSDGLTHDLFTVNTCLATGVKMIRWFIVGPMDRETYTWNDNQELVGIAAERNCLRFMVGNWKLRRKCWRCGGRNGGGWFCQPVDARRRRPTSAECRGGPGSG